MTRDLLAAAVARLSEYESADGIARYLTTEGVTGTCEDPETCAAAVWLSAQVGHPVMVGSFHARLKPPSFVPKVGRWQIVPFPEDAHGDPGPVSCFVLRFDLGDFPSLMKENA